MYLKLNNLYLINVLLTIFFYNILNITVKTHSKFKIIHTS